MSARILLGAKVTFWLALVAAGIVGLVLLQDTLVGLVAGAFTIVAVIWDSASLSRRRPPGDVVVGEIDHDWGGTTQKLHE